MKISNQVAVALLATWGLVFGLALLTALIMQSTFVLGIALIILVLGVLLTALYGVLRLWMRAINSNKAQFRDSRY